MNTIEWDKDKLKLFKVAYEKSKDLTVFIFEGNEFIPSYAKYLIEYLEGRLNVSK